LLVAASLKVSEVSLAENPLPTPRRTLRIDRLASDDGTATLVCKGQITVETSGAFKSEVKSLAPAHKHILADMSEVDFVDSFGLGDVLAAYIAARSVGCNLTLSKVHPRVKDLLNITRLASVLQDGVVPTGAPKATGA
jgi:anti-sigma B factor antagonist